MKTTQELIAIYQGDEDLSTQTMVEPLNINGQEDGCGVCALLYANPRRPNKWHFAYWNWGCDSPIGV